MRILLWKVHGSYTESFVRGDHRYLFVESDVHADGLGLGVRGELISDSDLSLDPPDVVVVQRLEELSRCADLGLALGSGVPAVFLEHNTPRQVPDARHPLADRDGWTVVHVTHFNRLIWDCGRTPTAVVEHGIVDPGARYTGAVPRAAFVVNEPVRRSRVTGADLLTRFVPDVEVDCFGIDADQLAPALGVPGRRLRYSGNLSMNELHQAMAQRRLYLHLNRWTSLGLSLLEAMHLAMPVVVLGATEAYRAVPPEAGCISTDPDELVRAARALLADPDHARACGRAARTYALEHYGLEKFLRSWDEVLQQAVDRRRGRVIP
ncbi:MAG TPA: glycosyltransferase [Propionibacteriaceae bacterium]|nr:glycosyltransferase [Propionibacteriaceae bacterium]